RIWREDAARLQLLKFFEAWGFDDPATMTARRKLSAILFS
ncbi:MAG TPA: tetratricopeptide repeat protein, partial [Acetobacteraceae bacterium]